METWMVFMPSCSRLWFEQVQAQIQRLLEAREKKSKSQPRGPGPFPPGWITGEAGWEGAGTRARALGIGQAG